MKSSLNDILYKIILAGIFILPFFPLIISTSLFFPYIVGKALIFRLVTEVIFAAWLVLMVRDPKYRPQWSPILWAILIWLSVAFLTAVLGVNPQFSFFSNFERMEGVITYLHLLAYFLVVATVLNTNVLWSRFFYTSIGASLIVVSYGLVQLLGLIDIRQGGGRLDSTFGNSAYLASYLIFFIFIVGLLLFWTPYKKFKIFYGVSILIYLFILYQTATRGAILGLIGGILLTTLLLAIFEKENKRLKTVSLGLLVLVLIFAGSFWLMRDVSLIKNSPVLSRFADISLTETTTKSRFLIWHMAWQGFKEKPILGWGSGNFQEVFNKYYDPRMHSQEPWFDRAHNVVFDWLIAGGILGLASYILIYLALLYLIWRLRSELSLTEKSLLTGLVSAYFFQNLFVFDNTVSYYLFFTVLAFVHFRGQKSEVNLRLIEKNKQKVASINTVKGFVISLGLIFILVISYHSSLKPYLTGTDLLNALRYVNAGRLDEGLKSFEDSLSSGSPTGRREARERLIQFTYNLVTDTQVDNSFKDAFIDLSVLAIEAGLKDNDKDARLYSFAGDLMLVTGRLTDALMYFTKASEISPKKQTILLQVAGAYMGLGQIEEALVFAKKSFELAEDFDEARIRYALIAFMAGQDELAEKLLLDRFDTLAVDNNLLLNFYASQKRFDLVNQIWEQKLANNQSDLRVWFSYAGSFLAQGKSAEAVRVLEEALIVFNESAEAKQEILDGLEAIRTGRAEVSL